MGPTWNDTRPLIRALDQHDDDLFRARYAIMRAGATADREAPSLVTYEALSTSLSTPNARKKRIAFGAFVGHTLLGTAVLDLQTQENQHLAEIDINVPPDRCRQVFGTSLLDHVHTVAAEEGRTTFLTEINVPTGWVIAGWPGSASPCETDSTAPIKRTTSTSTSPWTLARLEALTRASAPHRRPGDLVTWTGSCPQELVDAHAVLNTAMGQAVPTDKLDLNPPAWDADRVRRNDERMAAQGYTSITTVARHRGAEFAGYSLIFVDVHNPTAVSQDDTLVLSAHRGHRLGWR